MKSAFWILAILAGMLAAPEARAQFFFGNTFAVSPFGAARSSSFVRFGPRPAFVTVHYRWYFPSYNYPYSYWNYPYLGSGIYYSDPTIVINPPAPPAPRPAEEEIPKGKLVIKRGKDIADEKAPAPLPGKEAGGFRPVQPDDRARAMKQPPPEPAKAPEIIQPPKARPPQIPPVPVDSLSRGKQAFAFQEYGRAERLFQLAIKNEPPSALGHFLLAQAQFALDKYQESADAIVAGLRLQADWPKSKFRPEELYAEHRADFQEQLDHLKVLLDQNPADPVLLNLYAYQLWFTGRAEDAKPFFQRAARIAADKTWTDLFLPAPSPN